MMNYLSPAQQPVNGEDEGDSLARQAHSVKHHDHSHKPSLGNACSPILAAVDVIEMAMI